MFRKTHLYQYGSNPINKIRLTAVEAHAVNNLLIYEIQETPDGTYVRVNSDEVDMKAYDTATTKLNAYIESKGGSIECSEEWLEDHDVLTLIK